MAVNKNITTIAKPASAWFSIFMLCGVLSACGFKLKNNAPHTAYAKALPTKVILIMPDDKATSSLKQSLQNQLKMSGVMAELRADKATLADTMQVNISNIKLHKHRLVGTLSEVQLLYTANIQLQNPTVKKAPLIRRVEVQRSYQYDQATVNTANQQENRIIRLMVKELANKITQQVLLY